MTLFADLPVQRKLRLAMLLTSSLALLVACAVFLTMQYLGYRRDFMQTVRNLGRITAENSTATAAFKDTTAAEQTLETLRADPLRLIPITRWFYSKVAKSAKDHTTGSDFVTFASLCRSSGRLV